MENPIKMDDLGGKPTIFGNIRLMRWNSMISALMVKIKMPISHRSQGFFLHLIWHAENA